MSKLFKYLKPYWKEILLLCILVWIQVEVSLELPDFMAKIINQGVVVGDNAFIWHTGGEMLGLAFLGAIAMIGAGFFTAKVAAGFSMRVRSEVFTKVESFSLAEFDHFSTASLITRTTNDITQIQSVLVMMRLVLMAPMTGIGAVYKAYHTAPSMTWIMALGVGVMLLTIILVFSIAIPQFQVLQKLVDRLNLVTRENLTGLRVIRAFNRENFEEGKFEAANEDLTRANLFLNRLMVLMMPIMMLVFNLTSIGIVWVGSHLINTYDLQIGDMMAFMQYSMQVIMSFLMVSMVFIMIPRASVSAKRVAEILETEVTIKSPEKSKKHAKGRGAVEFKNVTFSYPHADSPVLENITFSARPGETTAFIGSTGSGKSTLINLIPRFYDVAEGEILIDGVNVRDYDLEDLYERIGYVPQRGVLFSGTVKDNIRYGSFDLDQKGVEKAARIAQATDFIENLEEKFDSPIAQGGTNVSGGQKQRLSIARAIAKDPEIYIFDDSFSALDFKTDAALRQALSKETSDKTVLIVAQRIGTIIHAGKIVVLDEGKIVGEGTHEELMKNNEVYQQIAFSQLSEEELSDYALKTPKLALAGGLK